MDRVKSLEQVFSLHNPNNISPFKVDVVVEPKGVFCLPPDMVLIQIAPKNQQLRLYFVRGISRIPRLLYCGVVGQVVKEWIPQPNEGKFQIEVGFGC
jgi:hypothetical protein